MQTMGKQMELVQELLTKTEEGVLNWRKTSQRKEYMVTFPQYAIRIEPANLGGASSGRYHLDIYNSQGELIQRVGGNELAAPTSELATEEMNLTYRVGNLYDLIRYQVEREDTTIIDNLLVELQHLSSSHKSA